MIYYAKILPDTLRVHPSCIGEVVPLLSEHQIYSDAIGSVKIISDRYAEIESTSVKTGDKLSAGSFIAEGNLHDVREVSVVKSPKYSDCEILEVLHDKPTNI